MLEFQAPLLMNDLIGWNSIIDTKIHLNPKGGSTHTRVEYSVIIRAPPMGRYKRRKENQMKGWNKNLEKDTREIRWEQNLGIIEVLLGPQIGNSTIEKPSLVPA